MRRIQRVEALGDPRGRPTVGVEADARPGRTGGRRVGRRGRDRRRRTGGPTRASPRGPGRPAGGWSASIRAGRHRVEAASRAWSGRRRRSGPVGRRLRARPRPSGHRPGRLEIVDDRPQVQPGPPDQQGPVPPAGDPGQGGAGPPRWNSRDGELLAGSTRSIRWYGHLGPVGRGRLGRADVHAPVDAPSSRPRRSRRPPAARASRQGQRRLARRGGAHQGHAAAGPAGAHRAGRLSRRRPGCGSGGAGAAVTSTSSPGRWWGRPPVDRHRRRRRPARRAPAPAGEVDQLALGASGRSAPPGRAWHGPSTRTSSTPPDPGPVPGERRALDHRPQALEPLGDDLGGHEALGHRRRPGARPGREDEGVGAVVGGLGHHLEGRARSRPRSRRGSRR